MALDIRKLRESVVNSGLLNVELADKIKCSQSAVSRVLDWKPGRQSKRMFRKVVAALGHDLDSYRKELASDWKLARPVRKARKRRSAK